MEDGELAYIFHELLSDWIRNEAKKAGRCCHVILSGGCFANRLLTELSIKKLEAEGFLVYTNEKVPPGDDGIALGQIYPAIK